MVLEDFGSLLGDVGCICGSRLADGGWSGTKSAFAAGLYLNRIERFCFGLCKIDYAILMKYIELSKAVRHS